VIKVQIPTAMKTRAKNKSAHPGYVDAPAPRCTHAEVEIDTKQKAVEKEAQKVKQDEQFQRIADFEDRAVKERQARASAPFDPNAPLDYPKLTPSAAKPPDRPATESTANSKQNGKVPIRGERVDGTFTLSVDTSAVQAPRQLIESQSPRTAKESQNTRPAQRASRPWMPIVLTSR
jgi:hypothetical protein